MRSFEFIVKHGINENTKLDKLSREDMIEYLMKSFYASFGKDANGEYRRSILDKASDDELRKEVKDQLSWSDTPDDDFDDEAKEVRYAKDLVGSGKSLRIDKPRKKVGPDFQAQASSLLPQIKSVVKQIFDDMYPDTDLYINTNNGYINISTNGNALGQIHGEYDAAPGEDQDVHHYYMTYNMTSIDQELDVIIGWAEAGDFKGVTSKIIKATFALGESAWGLHKNKTLVIEEDRSAGVWEKMAAKLNVGYYVQ